MHRETPAPNVTPLSHEGIQLEWHLPGIDLEIEVERPGHASVLYTNEDEGIDREWQVGADLTLLDEPIERLTH